MFIDTGSPCAGRPELHPPREVTPKTSDMKPDTVARVQQLELSDAEALSKSPAGTKFVRNSKRYTPWSDASGLVETKQPIELHSGQAAELGSR